MTTFIPHCTFIPHSTFIPSINYGSSEFDLATAAQIESRLKELDLSTKEIKSFGGVAAPDLSVNITIPNPKGVGVYKSTAPNVPDVVATGGEERRRSRKPRNA